MDRNWIFAVCMTILFSIVLATAFGDVTIGICLGICTGMAFGLLGNGKEVNDSDKEGE